MKGPDVTVANFPCVPDYFQATGAATGRYLVISIHPAWSLACPCPGTTQGAGGNLSPKICGVNTGSHIYIDAGAGLDTQAALTAVISEAATWNIKVTLQSSYKM